MHYRYVLPCLPFLFIWASQAGCYIQYFRKIRRPFIVNLFPSVIVGFACCWVVTSTLLAFPHLISYFNESVGAKTNAAKYLLDSNVDWGQDLFFLEKWGQRHGHGKTLYVAHYGSYSPTLLGNLTIKDWPATLRMGKVSGKGMPQIEDGYYALSVNALFGIERPHQGADGHSYSVDARPLRYLRSVNPYDHISNTMFIYTSEQMYSAYRVDQRVERIAAQ